MMKHSLDTLVNLQQIRKIYKLLCLIVTKTIFIDSELINKIQHRFAWHI